MSQEKLARALNVSFATINRWENGRRDIPQDTATLLECLAALLDRPSANKSEPDSQEIIQAVESAGVSRVVSVAAMAGKLPRSVLQALASVPAFAWIAATVGIGVLGSLPFFLKLGVRGSEPPEKATGVRRRG
jgi:transcriptional regulator with XRE-family HTH domain